jgi:hypothetical protein
LVKAASLAAAGAAAIVALALPAVAAAEEPTRWQARFERERPRVLRAIDGIPGPAGYEYETRYDSRRMTWSVVGLGAGGGLQLLTVVTKGIEPAELVPCAGLFYGDYDDSNDSGYYDTKKLLRVTMALPVCALFMAGAVSLLQTLTDPRPVWVRKSAKRPAIRLGGVITDQEARIHAIGHF